jgi:hypothetical protein
MTTAHGALHLQAMIAGLHFPGHRPPFVTWSINAPAGERILARVSMIRQNSMRVIIPWVPSVDPSEPGQRCCESPARSCQFLGRRAAGDRQELSTILAQVAHHEDNVAMIVLSPVSGDASGHHT